MKIMNQYLHSDEQAHISERLGKLPKIYSGRSKIKNILEQTFNGAGQFVQQRLQPS